MRVAVITPYYREGIETLSRCHESVQCQQYPATHFMVADGFPNDDLRGWDIQHIILANSHDDNGNTPRTIGAVSALNQKYDAIAFLDADNWYGADHINSLVELSQETGCEVAFSERFIVLPNGHLLPEPDPEDIARRHVDTSCFFITARAAWLLPMWAMMEQPLSPVCDQVMLRIIQERRVSHEWTGQRTVYFETNYRVHFEIAGLVPPDNAREIGWRRILAAYSHRRSFERIGFSFQLNHGSGPDER